MASTTVQYPSYKYHRNLRLYNLMPICNRRVSGLSANVLVYFGFVSGLKFKIILVVNSGLQLRWLLVFLPQACVPLDRLRFELKTENGLRFLTFKEQSKCIE